MDIFVDVLRMADIFAEKPQLNAKTQAKAQKQQQDETMKKSNPLPANSNTVER